jgi:hypothetical protein
MLYADSPCGLARKSYRPSPETPLALLRSVFHTNASLPVTPQRLSSRRRGVLTATLLVLFIAGCVSSIQRVHAEEVSLSDPFAVRSGGSAQQCDDSESGPSFSSRRSTVSPAALSLRQLPRPHERCRPLFCEVCLPQRSTARDSAHSAHPNRDSSMRQQAPARRFSHRQ